MTNIPIDPDGSNPAFHPACKIYSLKRLELRARALFESGLVTEENAIVCAIAVVQAWPEKPKWPEMNYAVCGPETGGVSE